jgi:predicted nucleotidyltransferase
LIVTALGDSVAAMALAKDGTAKLPEDQIPAGTDTTPVWAITPEKIEAAIRRIVRTAQPRKIIIFGSAARGEARLHSDLDILVVTKDGGEDSRKESVRIRRALRGISMPMDILVVPEKRLRQLAQRPGLVYREAIRRGRVVYDAAP